MFKKIPNAANSVLTAMSPSQMAIPQKKLQMLTLASMAMPNQDWYSISMTLQFELKDTHESHGN